MQTDITADIKELQPDVIVECYLEARYYHYDPEDIYELVDYNVKAENLVESDDIVTMQYIENDEYSATASLNDNFQELETACPEWDKETKAIHPKWLEHHQSGHLTKDPRCPVCMEEAGSKVNHRRKKGDRSPGVMRCDLAAFEKSADGHKYCLVAAVTIERESKLQQAHLDREWWSYACPFAGHMMREKVLGREWTYPLFGQLVGIWKSHDKAQASHWMIEVL